jgi:hypothetical protein
VVGYSRLAVYPKHRPGSGLDWFEALTWQAVCEENKLNSIGYGKGYVLALGHHRAMLGEMKQLPRVLMAHNQVK